MRKFVKKSREHFVLLFVVGSWSLLAAAQNPNPSIEVAKMQFQAKQVIPPSPDAAELGKYGNVPVSLFTGTPKVTIPLFELKGGSIALPISLSYNAAGYKPEDLAPWVGSGWSLNAGGVITRAVKGNPDVETNYFGVANILNPPNPLDLTPAYQYMKDIQDGTKETQPDVYYYNFGGHSGKFVLRPDQTVAKMEKDLKVITPCINSGCYNSKFTVIDEQGVTYVFDQVEATTSIPNDDFGQPSYVTYNYVSAWYLSSMISADGTDVIEFEYYSATSTQPLYLGMLPNKSASLTFSYITTYSGTANNLSYIIPPIVTVQGKSLKKVTLKKFSTAVSYIDIISAVSDRDDNNCNDGRKVNQVKVYSTGNGSDKLVKQFNFTYGYFSNLQNAYYKKRLRLDAVQEIATDGVTSSPPAYSFTYNTSFDLPERFTASLDHWGFYNASGNTSLLPGVWFPGTVSAPPQTIGDGANREASLTGSQASLLNKIQYPTGGYTTFEYELNRAKIPGNIVRDVGGVRIKQMIDYSFVNKQAVVKNYSYLLDDGTSSGSAAFPEYQKNSSYYHYPEPSQGYEYELHTISISTNSIYGLGTFQGSHIGYSQVIETQTDLTTGQALGKTVYKYEVGTPLEYAEDIRSGDLIKQSTYRNDNKLLEETTSTYQYSVSYDISAQVVKANDLQTNKTYYCQLGTNNFYNYGSWELPPSGCTGPMNYPTKLYLTNYSILVQNKQLTQQVHTIYDQLSNSYLTVAKNFTYGNSAHNYPTLMEEITTNGDKVKTAIKYVADYSSAPSASYGTIAYNINYMQQKNMMGLPIEKLQYRQDANGSNTRYISGQLTDHILGNPSKTYFLESKPLLTSVTGSSISSNTFNYDSHYRLAASMEYDNLMNLNQQSKTDDIATSYVWDYNQVYPVASVTGATTSQICYTSFESNGGGWTIGAGSTIVNQGGITGTKSLSGTVTKTVPTGKYIVTAWSKDNGNISVNGSSGSLLRTIGVWKLYEWSLNNISSVTVVGDNYDELRLYPKGAQMVTQTFEPLIGITSRCDVNNKLLYYEYDGLNRLTNVRDDAGNIVKNFRYNYGSGTEPTASTQTLFYNAATQQNFIKQGCTGGMYGDTVTYVVGYGKHAAVSQTEADALAAADKTANGQAYANSVGLCRYFSASKHVKVFKNDCSYEQGLGGFVWYDIPFGRYKSLISQADADAQAQAEINTLGQIYANTYGSCTCASEGVRFINGECETGQLHHGSSVYLGNGTWECSYYYTFSDAYVTGYYYYYSSSPCPIDD